MPKVSSRLWRCIGRLPASFPLPALAKVPGRCGPWQRVWPPCHSLLCATLRQVCQWNRYCTIFEADGFILFVSESAGFKPVKIHQMSSTLFRRVYRRMILNDVCRDSTWHSESKMYRDVYVPQDVTVWLLHQWEICRLELIVHHNEPMKCQWIKGRLLSGVSNGTICPICRYNGAAFCQRFAERLWMDFCCSFVTSWKPCTDTTRRLSLY